MSLKRLGSWLLILIIGALFGWKIAAARHGEHIKDAGLPPCLSAMGLAECNSGLWHLVTKNGYSDSPVYC